MKQLLIDGRTLKLDDVALVAHDLGARVKVKLSPKARRDVVAAREFIKRKAGGHEPIYGVNTGFGLLSKVRVEASQLDRLQLNLLRSHAVGIGIPLSEPETRAAILLRANTLAS